VSEQETKQFVRESLQPEGSQTERTGNQRFAQQSTFAMAVCQEYQCVVLNTELNLGIQQPMQGAYVCAALLPCKYLIIDRHVRGRKLKQQNEAILNCWCT
jgi:hypothetical protein